MSFLYAYFIQTLTIPLSIIYFKDNVGHYAYAGIVAHIHFKFGRFAFEELESRIFLIFRQGSEKYFRFFASRRHFYSCNGKERGIGPLLTYKLGSEAVEYF